MPLIATGSKIDTGDSGILETPVEAETTEAARQSPGFTGFVGAFNREENPVASAIMPRAEQAAFRESDSSLRTFLSGQATAAGSLMTPEDLYQPTPKMPMAEAAKQYPNPDPTGKPLFTGEGDIESGLAQVIHRQAEERFQAQTDIARFQTNHSWPVNVAASMAASMVDPLNQALGFLPGVGEEALAARVGIGLIGRSVSRAVVGAGLGGVAGGSVAALKLGVADDLHTDYSIRSALMDTLMGSVTAGILNVGVGAGIIDPVRYMTGTLPTQIAARAKARTEAAALAAADADTNYSAAKSSVWQIVTDHPVDVADFYPVHIKPQQAQAETAIRYGLTPQDADVANAVINHPFFTKEAPVEPEAAQRQIAESINPDLMDKVNRLEKQRQDYAAQFQTLTQQRQDKLSQGQGLIVDQIKQIEDQLQGRVSKAQRSRLEQRRTELESSVEELPGAGDLETLQQKMQESDFALRDLAPDLTTTMEQARQRYEQHGRLLDAAQYEDLIRQQNYIGTPVQGLVTRQTGTVEQTLAKMRIDTVDQINQLRTQAADPRIGAADKARAEKRIAMLADSLPPGYLDNSGAFAQARDFSGMADRAQQWQEIGAVPGLSADQVVRYRMETEQAAKNAAPPAAPTQPPKDYLAPPPPAPERPEGAAAGNASPKPTGAPNAPGGDYDRIVALARSGEAVSSSRIQGELGIGYNRASELRDQLLKEGVIDRTGKYAGEPIPQPPKAKPATIEEAYPGLDTTRLSDADKAELMAAHRENEKWQNGDMEEATKEAGRCVMMGGG